MIKKIVIGLLSLSLVALIIGIIISSVHKKTDNFVMSVKRAYSLTFDDEAIINVPLYFSKENKFMDKSNISSISLQSTSTKIGCDLLDTSEIGKMIYSDNSLIGLLYEIKIPCKNTLLLPNTKLLITSQSDTLEIEIGSISLRYYESLGDKKDITINESSVIAGSGTIEGMILNIESDEEVIIKDIIVDGTSVFVDLNNIKNITREYSEQTKIDEIISNYNLYTKQPNYSLDDYKIKGSVNILIPFKYTDKLLMESAPVIILYELNGISDTYVLDDFLYVNQMYGIIDLGGIVKCQL